MKSRRLLLIVLASPICWSIVPSQTLGAATDGIFVQSGPIVSEQETPVYDSEYAEEQRRNGSFGNTPEADARPGQYYFMLGAHAFRKQDYVFAVEMYQVAASWAYKPAEYNLGVMYARGQGVEANLPRAMAWMALAAERNEARYVEAREVIYADMTKEQFEQANAIWRELKTTYGDQVALRRAKTRWAQVRASMTGSRVGSIGNLTVGIPGATSGDPSSQKPANAAMAAVQAAAGVPNVRTTASSAAETTGGTGIDGSTAYRQLRESDNPYDPKFDRSAAGTAIVGAPETIGSRAPVKTKKGEPVTGAEDEKHNF